MDGDVEHHLREHMQVVMTDNINKPWIIHPYSKVRFRWDIVTIFVILFTIITIPLEFSFFDESEDLDNLKIWLIIVQIYFFWFHGAF